MQDITLNLTVEDLNIILQSLGEQPFARVYTLVGKIQQQAQAAEQNQTQPETASGKDDIPAASVPSLGKVASKG